MKLKALFLAFLIVYSPAVLAMNRQENQISESLKQVDPDDVCPVCLKLAKDLTPDQIKITNCCKQFICAFDAKNIINNTGYRTRVKSSIKEQLKTTQENLKYFTGLPLTDEHLDQMYKTAKSAIYSKTKYCPGCPQKKLSISNASVKIRLTAKPALTVIDSEKNEFVLSPELSAALSQCRSLEMNEDKLNNSNNPLDFSAVKFEQKRFLKKDLFIKLARLIADPVNETPNMVQNLEFFELANYLAAPDNILYLIANELWPLMQDQSQTNSYKKYIRQLAKPHLASPKQLIEYKEFNHRGNKLYFLVNSSHFEHSTQVNLSWAHISEKLENAGWYQDAQHSWYKVYPFCKCDGIELLWRYEDGLPNILNLTGHRLETVPENLLEKMHKTCDLDINLDYNPINSINESFFKQIAQARATGKNITISLVHSHLNDKQKKELTKKWHSSTTTFVQKYMNESTYTALAKGMGYLGSALTVTYLAHKYPQFVEESTGLSGFILGAIAGYKIGNKQNDNPGRGLLCGAIGAFATPIGLGYLFDRYPQVHTLPTHLLSMPVGAFITKGITDYAVIKLAKKSHPDISWESNNNVIWNTNYQLKF